MKREEEKGDSKMKKWQLKRRHVFTLFDQSFNKKSPLGAGNISRDESERASFNYEQKWSKNWKLSVKEGYCPREERAFSLVSSSGIRCNKMTLMEPLIPYLN